MMINVVIPVLNSPEIKYTIDVLLGEFLGLEYSLKIDPNSKVIIIKTMNGEIILESSFFDKEVILTKDNIPSFVKDVNVDLEDFNMNLLSLFEGETRILGKETYSIDILASTFFMLSRWEEYVNPERDSHNRFPSNASVALKFGFLDRTVVNEYVEFLWALLKSIGCGQDRKVRDYQLVPTHDVDRPYLFNSFIQNVRLFGGLIKRFNFQGLFDFCSYAIKGIDPWDTHGLFMDLSEKANVKSYFFFLPKGQNKHDGRYDVSDPKIKKLYKKIRDRGHHIGFHPSYDTYNNIKLFKKEKEELEEAVGGVVRHGRQHFLRFETPLTWQIWDECNMEWDSTMSYADCAGFRCGVCYSFPVYDIASRRQLELFERPLVVMEGSLLVYEGLSIDGAIDKVKRLKNQVKKYNGDFVFLYHNSSFFDGGYRTDGVKLLRALYD